MIGFDIAFIIYTTTKIQFALVLLLMEPVRMIYFIMAGDI